MIGAFSRFLKASRSAGVGARLSSVGSRLGSNLTGILKTSGGGIVGGGAGGYSLATLEQSLGAQSENRKLLVYGGVALLAIYSIGQLFNINLGQ